MHRALQIEEVLSDIFHHFSPDIGILWREETIPELAALARTCRAFKEPALDILWRVLHHLSPLLWCLPKISRRSDSDMVSWFKALVTPCA